MLLVSTAVLLVVLIAAAVILLKDPSADRGAAVPTFGEGDVYTLDVSRAPVDVDSPAMIDHLMGQITPHWGGVAALNVYQYNVAYFEADDSTPKVTVGFHDCQNKGATPPEFYSGPAYFVDVPIPENATTSVGGDSTMSIWNPDTDQLWEFWVMQKDNSGWSACWGGRIDGVSENPGLFPQPFGASASGLTMVGPMIGIDEARSGEIDHVMALGLISPAHSSKVRYPALRSDGVDLDPNAIPIGSRLRLDPSVDVNSLGLTPLATAIAKAAQTYGFVVVDRSGAVAVGVEDGRAAKSETGVDPWVAILDGVPPHAQLEGFPWARMQVIAPEFGRPD